MITDEEIFETLQEEAAELPDLPCSITPEAAIVAQDADPVDMTELQWEVFNPATGHGKPESECTLGSCENEATHCCTLLSGKLWFGCESHVDELLKMRVAKKKKVFEK